MIFLIVGLGGFLGAIARYAIYLFLTSSAPGFPWATLIVNVLGCVALALATLLWRPFFSDVVFLLFTTGFLGAFTTFSAFGLDSYRLIQSGQNFAAALYLALNLILGCGVFFLVAKFLR